VAVTEAAERWDPGTEIDQATATLIAMGQAVLSFAIVFVIVWVPLLLSIGLIALVAYAVVRRFGGRRPDRFPPLTPPRPRPRSDQRRVSPREDGIRAGGASAPPGPTTGWATAPARPAGRPAAPPTWHDPR
jgi:hypothetical protein